MTCNHVICLHLDCVIMAYSDLTDWNIAMALIGELGHMV